VLDAAGRDKWLVLDELDNARLDRAFGPLSSFLGGLPVRLPTGDEAKPPSDWRTIATAADGPLDASPALLRRFALVSLPNLPDAQLDEVIRAAAGGDDTVVAAVQRLVPFREVRPLGTGVFTDAARHAAERNAVEPADESTLAREVYVAHVARLLDGLDEAADLRLRELVERL
jgi:hypothetical protein